MALKDSQSSKLYDFPMFQDSDLEILEQASDFSMNEDEDCKTDLQLITLSKNYLENSAKNALIEETL